MGEDMEMIKKEEKIKQELLRNIMMGDTAGALSVLRKMQAKEKEIELEAYSYSINDVMSILNFFDDCKAKGEMHMWIMVDDSDDDSYAVAEEIEDEKTIVKTGIGYDELMMFVKEMKKAYREYGKIPYLVGSEKKYLVMIKPVEVNGVMVLRMLCKKRLSNGVMFKPLKIVMEFPFRSHIESMGGVCDLFGLSDASIVCGFLRRLEYDLIALPDR